MTLPDIVSREEWLTARAELLTREKALTRQRDALNADRRRLPMVRVDEPYEFEGPDGRVTLLDLFRGRRQLVVQHVMFGPEWDEVCPGCKAGLDECSPGLFAHLGARETTFAAIARAPWPMIAELLTRQGWAMDFYSSHGSRFNYDYGVTTADDGEEPGVSCFLRDGDAVFHTYFTTGRGTEGIGDAYGVLDLTALGRQEAWEEPTGRVEHPHGATPFFAT